jgi:hypothetical protein
VRPWRKPVVPRAPSGASRRDRRREDRGQGRVGYPCQRGGSQAHRTPWAGVRHRIAKPPGSALRGADAGGLHWGPRGLGSGGTAARKPVYEEAGLDRLRGAPWPAKTWGYNRSVASISNDSSATNGLAVSSPYAAQLHILPGRGRAVAMPPKGALPPFDPLPRGSPLGTPPRSNPPGCHGSSRWFS